MSSDLDKRPFFKSFLMKSIDCGWIDRKGKFYGCAFGNHDSLVESMGLEAWQAEEDGWIRVADTHWVVSSSFAKITQNQKNRLVEIGRCPDNRRYKNSDLKFEDVFEPTYYGRLIKRVTSANEKAIEAQGGSEYKLPMPSPLKKRAPF